MNGPKNVNDRWKILKSLWIVAFISVVIGQEPRKAPGFQQRDASSLPITERIQIGGDPDWLAIGFSSIWVSVPKNNELVRVSPAKGRIQARVALGPDQEPCYGIGIGPDRVWVLNCKSRMLARINPVTNKVDLRIPVSINPAGEGAIAVSQNSVWFISDEDGHASTLTQINSRSGRVVRQIAVGQDSAVVKAGFGSIWVISSGEGKVYRVDPMRGKVTARISVRATPRFATVGAGSLWVLTQSDGSITRIDPVKNEVSAVVPAQIPGPGGEICYGGGLIWATMNGTPVVRIDPRHNQVVDEYGNYKNADAIRFGFGSIWVSDHGKGYLWKIDPARMPAL